MIDESTIERLRIAVRVLNLRYNQSDQITEAEIGILKSDLGDDLANVAVEEIAATVIRRELHLEQSNERRVGRSTQLGGSPEEENQDRCRMQHR